MGGSGSLERADEVVERGVPGRARIDAVGQPRGDLLEEEGVAVRVAKRREGPVAGAVARPTTGPRAGDVTELGTGRLRVEDLADVGTEGGQLVPGLLDVRHDEVDALGRARLLSGDAGAELDRRRGSGRGELDHAEGVVEGEVRVEPPADP